MYKKLLYMVVVLLLGVSTQYLGADQSIVSGDIEWLIFPSSNTWDTANVGYGCRYHIMDKETVIVNGTARDTLRWLYGKFDVNSAGDTTLTYFVLYRFRLLDTTNTEVETVSKFIKTSIHKIEIKDDFEIPLIHNLSYIGKICTDTTRIPDDSCKQWIPIGADDLPDTVVTFTLLNSLSNTYNLDVDSLCDSMWAGTELYLSYPINLLDTYSDTNLNNTYGEYKFTIIHRGGLDSLKPGFSVYAPFFYTKIDSSLWYEYDLEFFPRKIRIYQLSSSKPDSSRLIWYERPYLYYATTIEPNVPDSFSSGSVLINDTLLTWEEDTIPITINGTIIHATDNVDISREKYYYGHYINSPGSIKIGGDLLKVPERFLILPSSNSSDTNTITYRIKVHHRGLETTFNTLEHNLDEKSTHFFLWLPGEIKTYAYNGIGPFNDKPVLFHYVRHNNIFSTTIFNNDTLPHTEVIHSSHYYLVLKINVVKKRAADSLKILNDSLKLSWVSKKDIEREFSNLASCRAWDRWWQDPHVLLSGQYDSLFADTVLFSFDWKPYIQLFRRGDTLFWNSFRLTTTDTNYLKIKYIVWKNANGQTISIPDTTEDTFLVIPGVSDTTRFMFQVQYNALPHNYIVPPHSLSYTSEPALTWYPSLKVNSDYVVTWPKCPCADFYEVWTKKASSEDWSIDTTKDTYYEIPGYNKEETIVKVRALKGQFPMAWGIIGHLNPPTNVKAKLIQADFSWQNGVVHVTWTDNSNMEDGYLLEYKFDSQSTWIQKWLPVNSTFYDIEVSHLSNYRTMYVKVYPVLYANPIDKAGDIYIGKGDPTSAFIYFRVLADSSYITNNLAGCSLYNKKATLITEDMKVYTLGSNGVVENGKGIESSIDVNENCDFVTLWNTGDSLLVQISSDTQSYSIYKVEDSSKIHGVAVNIDESNNIHVAVLLLEDNLRKTLLLYGKGPYNGITWDTVFSAPFIKEMDMYGIASTPNGNHILINYSIDGILYTCKLDSGSVFIFIWPKYHIWGKNLKNIYNPIYWPSTGNFWFAYLDVNDTLGLISIPIDSSEALVSNWKHYLPVEGNVHIAPTISSSYLGVAAPFPLLFSPIGNSLANAVELSLLNYETNDSIHQLRTISINTTERIDNFMGFLSFIKIDTIPDTLRSSIPGSQSILIDTIWRGYVSYRGEDSLYHVNSFNVTLNANSAKGGIQSAQGSLVFPYVDFNRTILNSKKEDLELSIYSPGAQSGSIEIYDITGRKIWDRKISLSRNSVKRVRISFKRFPQGVYFVRVKMGYRLFTKKILSIR